MSDMSLVWRVSPPSTGQWRSFHKRVWPSASLKDGTLVVSLGCPDEYVPADVKAGKHGPISINVTDRRPETIAQKGMWVWRTLKRKGATLDEVKAIAAEFVNANPEFFAPSQQRKGAETDMPTPDAPTNGSPGALGF